MSSRRLSRQVNPTSRHITGAVAEQHRRAECQSEGDDQLWDAHRYSSTAGDVSGRCRRFRETKALHLNWGRAMSIQ